MNEEANTFTLAMGSLRRSEGLARAKTGTRQTMKHERTTQSLGRLMTASLAAGWFRREVAMRNV
jgi:hypothetical protein